jgi:hypothetical protein
MMSKRAIGFWAATGLLATELVTGGILELCHSNVAFGIVMTINHLGYPIYVLNILGVWKLLGAVALLVPRFPILKEWAYAGVTFNMTGAVVSHLCSGDDVAKVLPPLMLLAVTAVSWALRPASRRCTSQRPRNDA